MHAHELFHGALCSPSPLVMRSFPHNAVSNACVLVATVSVHAKQQTCARIALLRHAHLRLAASVLLHAVDALRGMLPAHDSADDACEALHVLLQTHPRELTRARLSARITYGTFPALRDAVRTLVGVAVALHSRYPSLLGAQVSRAARTELALAQYMFPRDYGIELDDEERLDPETRLPPIPMHALLARTRADLH